MLKAPSPQHPLRRYKFLKKYKPDCEEVKRLEYVYPHFRFADEPNKEPLMHKPIEKKSILSKLMDWIMK